MALKPWYKIVTPREDLREGKPLDASEFAIHLDQVIEGRAPEDYKDPERFFTRTYLTKGLTEVVCEVIRRLSGETVGASPVINLTTQFGGGKTHALTLLYHLIKNGERARNWIGVNKLLDAAQVKTIPQGVVAIFVGTAFDVLKGHGGNEEPTRFTPWGEIAWQIGGEKGYEIMKEHDVKRTAPSGNIIRKLFPPDKSILILMDEVLNYMNRARARKIGSSNLSSQFLQFLQNLTSEASGRAGVSLVLSLPMSEQEMTVEDQADFGRLQKLSTRVDKPYVLSEGYEIVEIIRRRLFEYPMDIGTDGKKVISEYVEWIMEHRQQLPSWFPVQSAHEIFESSYPFHPTVLSVFERKWQTLPRFQQTRGILRLLALWVSKAYQEGFKGAHRDPLITLGTAPLDDSLFRAAVFEQLGESRLEAAVMTDIAGKKSHAVRLDEEAVDTIKKARLHRKVACAVFFESSGGQAREEATLPEIRLALGEPDLDIGNIETALESLTEACYYLTCEKSKYRFSLVPNLNKLLSDRRASIQESAIKEAIRAEIQRVFSAGPGIERVFFPEKSGQIPDRAALTLVILPPEQSLEEEIREETFKMIDLFTREHGASARTFKSALLWAVPENPRQLNEDARKLLAWEALEDEADELRLESSQRKQLSENMKRAERDLRESVWRTYKNVYLLDKNNQWKCVDLGLVHSSAADSLVSLILSRLKQEGDIEETISPNFLVRNWPPAFTEWSTKSVRDAFFASPQFPRLINPETIKQTIADGVVRGLFGYAGKTPTGQYKPFYFATSINAFDIEISEYVFLIPKEAAQSISEGEKPLVTPGVKEGITSPTPEEIEVTVDKEKRITAPAASSITWGGEIPPQKWMNFYTKVLSKFATGEGLKIYLTFEAKPEGGISSQKIEETKVSLRELGLKEDIEIKEQSNEQEGKSNSSN
ncbi:MAG: ATP-binding protein [Candidatus Marinimicrobia bacterium]|nr:ATP-binding protein [Candidatus Neomarinimicrobiota bacterium]